MEKIIFFITHKTLDYYNADLCFKALSLQQTDSKFDKMYIYNSHEEELSNNDILYLFENYELNRFINQVEIFNYDKKTDKTLGADINVISDYFCVNYNGSDKILFLKSDILLSVNYFDILDSYNETNELYFTAPFILAKKRIDDDKIFNYLKRENYIGSDDITFFVEDQTGSKNNDLNNRDISIFTEQIEFISCEVIKDFSCHYLTKNIINKLKIKNQSWGGINFSDLKKYYIGSDKCFVIHKYHDIISDNRTTDREGIVHRWMNS